MACVHTSHVETSESLHVGMFEMQSCARGYQCVDFVCRMRKNVGITDIILLKQFVQLCQQSHDKD